MDRTHSLSGKKTLDWFFANRKWVRAPLSVIECAFAIRSQPESEASIRFLITASKRAMKRAHDRNKSKRWMRAAIAGSSDFSTLEGRFSSRSEQLLIMMR